MRKFILGGLAVSGGLFLALGIAGATTTVSPPTLDFGEQAIGTTSPAQTVTVTTSCNPGTPVTTGTTATTPCFDDFFSPQVSISGPFDIATNNCEEVTLHGTDQAPDSCTILVTFTPTANGPATGQLTVTDGGGGEGLQVQAGTRGQVGPAPVVLTGTGAVPGTATTAAASACPGVNAAAAGFTPRKPTKPTVLGVRARLAVSEPSSLDIDATLGYKQDGKSKTADLGHHSLGNPGSRKLRLALPESLRGQLSRHAKVTLDLDIVGTPLSKCVGQLKSHLSLKTKVVNVSTKLLTP